MIHFLYLDLLLFITLCIFSLLLIWLFSGLDVPISELANFIFAEQNGIEYVMPYKVRFYDNCHKMNEQYMDTIKGRLWLIVY
jgi:hypothetical protein